ncbi:hypothetical protein Trydic_g12648 [Trypoxylus dichotomus]
MVTAILYNLTRVLCKSGLTIFIWFSTLTVVEERDISWIPFNAEIRKEKYDAFLVVNISAKKLYADDKISCCYSNISRDVTRHSPDHYVKISKCLTFSNKVKITNDAIKVNCYVKKNRARKVYANTHAIALMTDDLKRRKNKFHKANPPSVLIIGIDSVSRLNFARTLPSTSNYLKQWKWINYKAYNKVGYNTFPNIMALLTGLNLKAIKQIADLKLNFLDVYHMIWKDFQRLGYVTAYAEDQADMNTFTFGKKGFKDQPTDFYFRPYTLATETMTIRKEYSLFYCAGPESYGERILNIAKDFTRTFSKQPVFGFFWMNSFSHDNVNTPMRMDDKIKLFFRTLQNNGVMNTTIIIFLSDHGIRQGKIRHTRTGWFEERLPFLHFWIPKTFRDSHKREYKNLQQNSEKLTTPYDIYMTLQHILNLSNLNYIMKPSLSCPKCRSLFSPISSTRSCADALIDTEFCTCMFYKDFDPRHPLVLKVAKFVINETRRSMFTNSNSVTNCAVLEVGHIHYSRIAVNYPYRKKNVTYMVIQFETKPRTVLEATVRLEETEFGPQIYVEGQVHRLDLYKYTGNLADWSD